MACRSLNVAGTLKFALFEDWGRPLLWPRSEEQARQLLDHKPIAVPSCQRPTCSALPRDLNDIAKTKIVCVRVSPGAGLVSAAHHFHPKNWITLCQTLS